MVMNTLKNEFVNRNMVSQIECLESAKVPLLKLIDKLTGIHVDISFSS